MNLESVENSQSQKEPEARLEFASVTSERETGRGSQDQNFRTASAELPVLEFSNQKESIADRFQKTDRDREFDKFLESFDLNSDKFRSSYKTSGSTIGLKISLGSDGVAKWSPKNGTSDHEAQEVSHRLAQYLNVSDRVTPSAYYNLTGNALEQFRNQVANSSEENVKDQRRVTNREEVLQALRENPNSYQGVITPWIPTITEVRGLNKDNSTVYGAFNSEHPIADLIKADGPMPGDAALWLDTAKGSLTAPEKQLAKEFSQIMVIDILTGQYDRFNGSNIEATYDAKSGLHFFARDNGGASMSGSGNSRDYFDIVSRFDKKQIQQVEQLLKDLNGPDAKSLVAELHLNSDPQYLKQRASDLIERVNSLRKQYGDRKVFFSD